MTSTVDGRRTYFVIDTKRILMDVYFKKTTDTKLGEKRFHLGIVNPQTFFEVFLYDKTKHYNLPNDRCASWK